MAQVTQNPSLDRDFLSHEVSSSSSLVVGLFIWSESRCLYGQNQVSRNSPHKEPRTSRLPETNYLNFQKNDSLAIEEYTYIPSAVEGVSVGGDDERYTKADGSEVIDRCFRITVEIA